MVSLHAALALVALSSTGQTVLLDFYADWCGPCKAMDPVVKQLAAQGYPVRQINIDRDRATAARFHVQRIPCFVMVVNGREVDRSEGMTTAQHLVQMIRAGTPPAAVAPPAMLAGPAAPTAAPPPGFEAGQFCPVQSPLAPSGSGGPMVPVPAPARSDVAVAPGELKSDAELLSVTARLRIEDANGWSCGSGTVIDSRAGQALILTCGHVFRDSQGQGRVEVDFFGVNALEKIPGKVIAYDLDRDVGLVSVYVPRPLLFARVAPPEMQLRPGDPIVTAGCDHGNVPDVRRTRVTSVGRYGGAPNVEIADLPVLGRSGGGMFTPDGLVIGVCNAADPPNREGLYAALPSIYDAFRQARIEELFHSPTGPAPAAIAAATAPPLANQMPIPTSGRIPAAAPSSAEPTRLSPEEQSFLDEVRRQKTKGSKVICVICPTDGPSEVRELERASAALLERLSSETPVNDVRQPAR